MSNIAFDRMWYKVKIHDLKETIAEYESHLESPEIDAEGRAWLAKVLPGAKQRLETYRREERLLAW